MHDGHNLYILVLAAYFPINGCGYSIIAVTIAGENDNNNITSIIVGTNKGSIQSIRPPKETKHERTRESRAQKIQ